MFIRLKDSGHYQYLQLVHNHRQGTHIRQQVLCTLGRLDQLTESGALIVSSSPSADLTRKVKSWMISHPGVWKPTTSIR